VNLVNGSGDGIDDIVGVVVIIIVLIVLDTVVEVLLFGVDVMERFNKGCEKRGGRDMGVSVREGW
jgi:hypothetical protein